MDADLKSKPGIVHSTDHYDSWLLALEPAFAHDLKQKLKVMAGEPGGFPARDVLSLVRALAWCVLGDNFRSRRAGRG